MLTILSKNDLANILVIVTRYFGGILLGTGGLVKAYSKACSSALEKAQIVNKQIAQVYKIEINYSEVEQFKYIAKNNNIIILNEEYIENVILEIAAHDEVLLKNILEKQKNVKKIEFIKEIYM